MWQVGAYFWIELWICYNFQMWSRCISRTYPSIDVRWLVGRSLTDTFRHWCWKVRWIMDRVSYIYSLKSITRSILAVKILAPLNSSSTIYSYIGHIWSTLIYLWHQEGCQCVDWSGVCGTKGVRSASVALWEPHFRSRCSSGSNIIQLRSREWRKVPFSGV